MPPKKAKKAETAAAAAAAQDNKRVGRGEAHNSDGADAALENSTKVHTGNLKRKAASSVDATSPESIGVGEDKVSGDSDAAYDDDDDGGGSGGQMEEEEEEEDSDDLYFIEALMAVRRANNWAPDRQSYQVAVKWHGYEDPTWQHLDILQNDRHILHQILNYLTTPEDELVADIYDCDPQPADEEEGQIARLG